MPPMHSHTFLWGRPGVMCNTPISALVDLAPGSCCQLFNMLDTHMPNISKRAHGVFQLKEVSCDL